MKDCVVPENNHPPPPTEYPFTWKETLICQKCCGAILLCKERKNPFIHGSKLSNNLNFAL